MRRLIISALMAGLLSGCSLLNTEPRFGYINQAGNMVAAPNFVTAHPFSEGYAYVCQGYKHCNFIDKEARPLLSKWNLIEAQDFSEGLAYVKMDLAYANVSGPGLVLHGYINKTGKFVIMDDKSYLFDHGLDELKKTLQEKEYGANVIREFYGGTDFVNGKAFIFRGVDGFDDSGAFMVDITGREVHREPLNMSVVSAIEGTIIFSPLRVRRNSEHQYGIMDIDGKVIVPPTYSHVNYLGFSEGLLAVRKPEDQKWTLIDKKGTQITESKFSNNIRFHEGYAVAQNEKGAKVGFIDRKGKWLVEPKFKSALSFSQGLAAIESMDGRWGYVDTQGNIVIKPQFLNPFPKLDAKEQMQIDFMRDFMGKELESVMSFSEGLAGVKAANGKFGFINQSGEFVIEPQFTDIQSFSEGLAAFCKSKCCDKTCSDSKWGFINKKGEVVVEPRFISVTKFKEGMSIIQNRPYPKRANSY